MGRPRRSSRRPSGLLARLLVGKAYPRVRGAIGGLPLRGRVEVLRDRWGIPHLWAECDHDLFAAQGFVHAQDRLWQMEILRRFNSGMLSEIAGEAALGADVFARMLGLPGMRRRAAAALSESERAMSEAYAEGVNACLAARGRDLPLEFRSMGFMPEPWTVEDQLSFLIYLAWNLSFAPLATKLFALVKGKDLTLREWDDLFPSSPGERLPPDPYFDSLAKLRIGALHPGVLATHRAMPAPWDANTLGTWLLASSPGAVSNNWAVAKSADGKPLLANDPHLGLGLPAVWYLCHLHAPGIDAAGASVAGSPCIVIGRNPRVAWGFTNVMLDSIDVLLLRVDPADPLRYRIADRWLTMERDDLRIGLPKGRAATIPLYRTALGPAVTAVERGIEAVAVLRWYGTLPEERQTDRSLSILPALLKAAKAADAVDAGRSCSWISQNLLAADADGHIAWHAIGAAPVRHGYTGRLPGDGSAGADWDGFLPYDQMPHLVDPPEGFIVTANQKSTDERSPHPLSHSWAGPYRHQRITSLLRELRTPTVEDFRRVQADIRSLPAERMLDKVLAIEFRDPRAREAADLLRSWDREVSSDSRGAAVFEAFLVAFERALTERKLGAEIGLYINARMYGIVDVALDRLDSPWWGNEEPRAVVERRRGGRRAVRLPAASGPGALPPRRPALAARHPPRNRPRRHPPTRGGATGPSGRARGIRSPGRGRSTTSRGSGSRGRTIRPGRSEPSPARSSPCTREGSRWAASCRTSEESCSRTPGVGGRPAGPTRGPGRRARASAGRSGHRPRVPRR